VDTLFPLVYGELRVIARRKLGGRTGETLGTTALVHEAYLKLVDQSRVGWRDRAHFFAVAAMAMRQILVDHARHHAARKRGGGWRRVSLQDDVVSVGEQADALLELDRALERLAGLNTRLARVVECRFFGGLTEQETAEALGVTERTVRRDWVKARGLLYHELGS
jgi:RNA polymerase sigma factor (TIGR02999 family)